MDRTAINKVPVHYDQPRKKNIYTETSEGDSDEDTPKCYQVSSTSSKSSMKQPVGSEMKKTPSVDFSEDDHIYEMEPTPLYEDTDMGGNPPPNTNSDDGSIYENTDFTPLEESESVTRKISSPAVLQDTSSKTTASQMKKTATDRTQSASSVLTNRKKKRHTPDDYEDPDKVLDNLENDDYMDMQVGEGHNMYIDPEDLKRGSPCSMAAASSGSFTSASRTESTSSTPGPTSKNLSYVGMYSRTSVIQTSIIQHLRLSGMAI